MFLHKNWWWYSGIWKLYFWFISCLNMEQQVATTTLSYSITEDLNQNQKHRLIFKGYVWFCFKTILNFIWHGYKTIICIQELGIQLLDPLTVQSWPCSKWFLPFWPIERRNCEEIIVVLIKRQLKLCEIVWTKPKISI